MKKRGFIKNKVVEQLAKASVDKVALIPPTHMIKPSMESYSTWIVRNQHYSHVSYKVMHPFTEYASCTCEWAMSGNLCKHQIMIILMVTNVTQEDVIEYCGTWYGSNCGGLPTMFAYPKHIRDDSNFENDGFTNDCDKGVIDIGGIKPMNESLPPTNDGGACVEPINSVVSLHKTFICLCHTM